jgi:ketosteroid isomerase-like protein
LSSDTSKEEIVRILHTSFKVAAHRPLSILFEEAAMDANDFNLVPQIYIDNIVNFFQDLHKGKHNGVAENIKKEFVTIIQYIRDQFNQANLEIELDVEGVEDLQSQVIARIVRQ